MSDTMVEEAGAESLTDFMAKKKAQGLTDDEVMVLANMRFGGQDSPTAPATPGSGEQLGPDPAMVARYNKMMKTYVPPKTRFKFAAVNREDPALRAMILEALVETAKTMEKSKKEMIADAVLAKLDGYGGVELPKQFHTWVNQWRYWESARRRLSEQMGENEILGIIIREHWHQHGSERAMLQSFKIGGGSSGPAGTFNPGAGTWGS